VDKQRKTAAELEEIVKQRIGAGDFKVTVHRNPETGWQATIYGRQPAEVHRCQVMAETIVIELCYRPMRAAGRRQNGHGRGKARGILLCEAKGRNRMLLVI
jgi:hypothetical protein